MELKGIVFFDLDGVVYPFNPNATREEWMAPGYYFSAISVIPAVKKAVEKLIEDGFDVRVLSCAPHNIAENDKRNALKRDFGEEFAKRAIILPYGNDKSEAVQKAIGRKVCEWDLLIDDFSPNCHSWLGKAIKAYNGINGTHGTWKGASVRTDVSDYLDLYIPLKAYCELTKLEKVA